MGKKLTYLLGILLTIVIGTLVYCYLCHACHCSLGFRKAVNKPNTINEMSRAKIEDSKIQNPFVISDTNTKLNIKSTTNFNFNASNFSILKPISPNLDIAIGDLKNYLDTNPSKSIEITGYYKANETNTSAFPNLGIARANSIKNYLVTKGFSSKKINTSGRLNASLVTNENDVYQGPLNLTIKDIDHNDNRITALANKIKQDPIILYFANAQTSIELTSQQRQKIADISTYLDKVDAAKVIVTGHTDDKGKRTTNRNVSQKRANFAKNYLVQNGISESKIKVIAAGLDTPIATNTTEEGRAKNRRVEITINELK